MINAIEEDDDMKAKLFPPVGPNPRKQGGLPKTDFQYLLAQKVFENHPQYGPVIARVKTPAQKKPWITKIKNRIKV